MNDLLKKEVLKFLMSQKVGVLSTISENKPHGTYIYYIADENFDVYFTTVVSTRKHKNISSNMNVAFTVGTIKPPKTVQIEGPAEVVTDKNIIMALTALYTEVATEDNHYPVPLTKLDWGEGVIMYRIRPTRLTWSNFASAKGKEGQAVSLVLIDKDK
jgi:nitroimidazol reductase NimA-like FMN-containing flavoprotein (pyridoxamine 5'-phosphate oxidase superfamily)